ncbi:MAG: methionyl-tRNA formyltransferase [Draconibacterium sp.]|nr:MAG: methionyl-tRNA formyltransferase [Draconibacterium sp.]
MDGKELRIIFMGTPVFAVASLRALVEGGYNIVGVITAPDKPAGRGQKTTQSAIKKYAIEKDLLVLQPEKLRNKQFIDKLKSLNADLQVVVAFRMLPEIVWAMPRLGTFNLHASLLPQYRGAAPIHWAVINGETKTGLTTFLLNLEIDTGKILFREEMEIGAEDTTGDVHDRLMEAGASLVLKTVDAIASGITVPIAQEKLIGNEALKKAPKLFKEDCRIYWNNDCEKLRNLIRGLSPFPTAWSNLTNKETGEKLFTKLFFAEISSEKAKGTPGEIKSDGKNYLDVACKNGWLRITILQVAGKKRMEIEDFLRGFQQIENYCFR